MGAVVRRARSEDQGQVEKLVLERAEWMARQGLRGAQGWERNARVLAGQCTAVPWPVWLLEFDGQVVARTAGLWESPAWGFTEQEQAQPSLFLHGTVSRPDTDSVVPGGLRPGHLLALCALYLAAGHGAEWVRRGTGDDPGLVAYYTRVQGWQVLRSVQRQGQQAVLLQRAVHPLPDPPAGIEF